MTTRSDRPDTLPMGVKEGEARGTIELRPAHDEAVPPPRADIERLRDLRDRIAVLKAIWDAALEQLKATHEPLLTELAQTQKMEAETLAVIKAAAEAYYAATQVKQSTPGVSVTIRKTIAYDEAAVIAWAETAAPFLVETVKLLDRKMFEGLVKVRPQDYSHLATIVETPKAQLASDLGKALASPASVAECDA